ncbi:MAG: phospho-N-acetylmuramoyl-pentapeptide-transferase [Lachnospiraceae bacterium]|nr:phospho-N-acetylmuramoyl-pentapeptide-transferase [Lachnospiraceae bacterium]
MLFLFVKNLEAQKLVILIGLLIAFVATARQTHRQEKNLPRDAGREFAHEGAKSAGKARGAGIIFVHIFNLTALIFMPVKWEYIIYMVLIQACMLTGYLDDASDKPWSPLRKGLLDLAIAVLVAVEYLYQHGSDVYLALSGIRFHMPAPVFFLLAVGLVWMSINVTNCADGVDGLSGTLVIATLIGFYNVMNTLMVSRDFIPFLFLFMICLLAYLWFNATPSILMMGDAGSRAMGLMIAICALLSGAPFLYLILAAVLLLDGGLGLLKVSLIKVFHIHILKNIRTPLHDHVRKNMGWSNTQCVFRFVIIQIMLMMIVLFII